MLVTYGVDYAYNHHQETYLAVDGADVRMLVCREPYHCRHYACYGSQQEYPPQYPRRLVPVLRETDEPVAPFIMKVYMPQRQCGQHYSEGYVRPY